jgi:hypothetical protein
LTVRSVESGESIGSVESSASLEGADGRQGRCSPSVGNHTEGKARVGGKRRMLQDRYELVEGVQSLFFRPVAGHVSG